MAMKIRLLLSLAFLWAACATAVAAPTVQISPSVSPAGAALREFIDYIVVSRDGVVAVKMAG